MTEIEKIKKYIQRTNAGRRIAYGLKRAEWMAIDENFSTLEAIAIAFEYGKAKGYRAAKAEVRK